MAEHTQMTLRLTRRTKQRLVALADLRGVAAADIVETALKAYFDALGEGERTDLETLLALLSLRRR